jgi:hypothetical protein
MFKDSPLFTDSVRERITRDLTRFRDYFVALGIDVPADLPPIGTDPGLTGMATASESQFPIYRWKMDLGDKSIPDPSAITRAYSGYVIDSILDDRRSQHPNADLMQDMRASVALATYYNWSFWNHKPARESERWATPLWLVRRKFGPTFTDLMLSYTLKALRDNPEDQWNADFDTYFYKKIKTGDSVLDDRGTRMADITSIIENSGLSVTKTKAELAFFVQGEKGSDGNVLLHVDVSNTTDVSADSGEFRLELFPGCTFIVEPEESTMDPRTTVTSVRLFRFESIAAHSVRKIELVVSPKSLPDGTFQLIGSYSCKTCASDNRLFTTTFRPRIAR